MQSPGGSRVSRSAGSFWRGERRARVWSGITSSKYVGSGPSRVSPGDATHPLTSIAVNASPAAGLADRTDAAVSKLCTVTVLPSAVLTSVPIGTVLSPCVEVDAAVVLVVVATVTDVAGEGVVEGLVGGSVTTVTVVSVRALGSDSPPHDTKRTASTTKTRLTSASSRRHNSAYAAGAPPELDTASRAVAP